MKSKIAALMESELHLAAIPGVALFKKNEAEIELIFDWATIRNQASESGYFVLDLSTPLPAESLEITKVCQILQPHTATFLHRKIWKGKPTKEFHRHRDGDFPAFMAANHDSKWTYKNSLWWFQEGEVSRKEGSPAMMSPFEIIYAVNGKWHRVSGPAKINAFHGESWYENHTFRKQQSP